MLHQNIRLKLALLAAGVLTSLQNFAQDVSLSPNAPGIPDRSEIIERGQDFAVYRSIQTFVDSEGVVSFKTNQFSLLENGLNYLDNGVWKESEDVIEPFPDGAVARRGPNKAVFSPDLNAAAVFDIEGSDGRRVRGGVRQIQQFS